MAIGQVHTFGNCVKNNPAAFHPKEQPWIQAENATTDEIIATVDKCPSGALSYYRNKDNGKP